ncbi:hypothetical protein ACJJTC_012959 [Scirpophaga incertulas]
MLYRVCFLWYLSSACGLIFTPIVNTTYGQMRGVRSISGQKIFYGVQYAKSDRFKLPTKPDKWDGVFDAIQRFGSCAQIISILKLGTEECLRLDLYTPHHATEQDRLPVLVFFHGGAYYYGSKLHYDPEFLVTKNIVAIIVNYRVGALGFLCLNNVANLGLKDQVAALKWIKENVSAFGGDPDNVTLSGQSAGASAAAMHMLSNFSKGLFHKLILMSGSPLTPWAFNLEPQAAAFYDSSKLTNASNEKDVYNFFTSATVDDILTVAKDTSINPRYFKYAPCIDSQFKEPFFEDAPYNLIKSGRFTKVPILTGITNVEGLLFYGLNSEKTLRELDSEFVEKLPSVFSWCSRPDRNKIANLLRSHYFGLRGITKDSYRDAVLFYSDWIANGTAGAFVELMNKYSDQPVYNYVFAYEGDRNFAKALFGGGLPVKGATHSDDIFYVFKPAGLPLILSNRDKLVIDRLTTMFTNFMKFGNPTPAKTKLLPVLWPTNSTLAMRLDAELSVVSTSADKRFYYDLLCTYGQEGFVPCDSQSLCNK